MYLKSCLLLRFGIFQYPWENALARLADGAQVSVQAQTEADHPEVEEGTQGQAQACHDVQPLLTERSGVGVCGNDGIVVQQREDQFVA